MRYLLPENMTTVSIGDEQYHADEDGFLIVPDDAPADTHAQLQSPYLWNLKVAPERAAGAPVTAGVPVLPPAEQKRRMAAMLEAFGVGTDGDVTAAFLRGEILKLMNGAEKEAAAEEAAVKAKAKAAEKPADKPAEKAVDKTPAR